MKHILRKLSAKNLEITNFENFKSLGSDEKFWLEIQADSRPEVIQFLSELNFNRELIDLIKEPSNITRVNFYGTNLLFNL